MDSFEDIHRRHITGSLAMFDRLIFRGHLQRLFFGDGVRVFLWEQGVPLTEFGSWAKQATDVLCDHAQQMANDAGRPYIYLEQNTTRDTGQSKEDLARKIAARDGISEGLICVLRILEPSLSFRLRSNRKTQHLEVVTGRRLCVQLYFYFIDPEFGFMHVKLQTWLPFSIPGLAERAGVAGPPTRRGGRRLSPPRQRPVADRRPSGGIRSLRTFRASGLAPGS